MGQIARSAHEQRLANAFRDVILKDYGDWSGRYVQTSRDIECNSDGVYVVTTLTHVEKGSTIEVRDEVALNCDTSDEEAVRIAKEWGLDEAEARRRLAVEDEFDSAFVLVFPKPKPRTKAGWEAAATTLQQALSDRADVAYNNKFPKQPPHLAVFFQRVRLSDLEQTMREAAAQAGINATFVNRRDLP